MATLLARSWWMFALRGVIAILFGVAALARTNITLEGLVILFGSFALLDGTIAIAESAAIRVGLYRRWVLLEGIMAFAAGIVTLVWPSVTASVLLCLIAAWAIIGGVLQIMAAVQRRHVIEREGWFILSGLLSVAVGMVLALQPTAGALALVWLIGVFSIVYGILLLVLAFRLRDAGNPIKHLIEGDETRP